MKKTAIDHSYRQYFFLLAICKAQSTADTVNTNDKEKAFQLSAATAYASRLHYYGRTDSLKSSALIPTIHHTGRKTMSPLRRLSFLSITTRLHLIMQLLP
jgi:hypothetical protein